MTQRKRPRRNLKEDYRDSTGHISFPNPNYSCAAGANAAAGEPMERRTNRFQGIFKYDKSQVIVYCRISIIKPKNVYLLLMK